MYRFGKHNVPEDDVARRVNASIEPVNHHGFVVIDRQQ